MKLTVLVDNNTYIDRYFLGEPALSFFIEEEDQRILFDTGYSDIFIQNAQKMNIDLRVLDYVAFSHGHSDHTWGITHLMRLFSEAKMEKLNFQIPTIVGHPVVFESKLDGSIEIGSITSLEKIKRHFPVHLSKDPFWITEKLVYLGQINRTNDFEGKKAIGKLVTDQGEVEDFNYDDSALAYKASEGLVIIVGCAHSGICNIIEQAKKLCGEERIVDVIGGFHLLDPEENHLQRTMQYFKNLNPKNLHACHCTDLRSKMALSKAANLYEVGVGLKLCYK